MNKGKVITFYSYKGGTGRSMALANVAVVLSRWGFKTLIIDWDLEAPGLENYFSEYIDKSYVTQKEGILDYLLAQQQNGRTIQWQDYIVPVQTPLSRAPIHLMPSGKRDESYFQRLKQFDIGRFYEDHAGGRVIERLREGLIAEYDFVLIDSRTGVTDTGGICTIQMPDLLVILSTPTEQGLKGVNFIADSARKGQQALPVQRQRILTLPVPTRIDANTEFKISQEWAERFATEWTKYYDEWLPLTESKRRFVDQIKLPYISYFSYGEKLPIIEQGTTDKAGLGYAYESLGALIANGLGDAGQFINDRDAYVTTFDSGNMNRFFPVEKAKATGTKQKAVQLFCIYNNSDVREYQQLRKHLTVLEKKYPLRFGEDQIMPGDVIQKKAKTVLEKTDAVVLLVGNGPLAYNAFGLTVKDLLENEKAFRIIPVYLSPKARKNDSYSHFWSIAGLPEIGVEYQEESLWDVVLPGIERIVSLLADEKNAALPSE